METASPTEQFVGEGVPAFFHVEEPDVYHFERRSRTHGDAPGDAALNKHYLEGDVALKGFPFNCVGLDVNDEG